MNLRSLRAFSHATFQLKGQRKEVILLSHSESKVNGVKEVIFNKKGCLFTIVVKGAGFSLEEGDLHV